MKYNLLASDMDGTLLDPDSRITEKTADAVRRAQKAGKLFVIATGRAPQGVRRFIDQLDLQGPVICYNGAMIIEARTGKILYEQGLLREDAARILQLGRHFDVTMCIWAGNQLYGSRMDEKLENYRRILNVIPKLAQSDEELLDIGITKILFYDEEDRIAQLRRELEQETFRQVNYCTSSPCYLEFFSGLASKAAAMEQIGRLWQIPREQMIAVGDGENDLSMIGYAGLGVAMANAPETVREKAGQIAPSNREDGVAFLIEKYLL